MKVYKYVLLGAALMAAQPSVAAVIKLGPTCNVADAIKAANTDKRVRGCRPGRGADTIVGLGVKEPKRPYPLITSNITIKATPNLPPYRTLQLGAGSRIDKLLRVGFGGKLTLTERVVVVSAVEVEESGHLVLTGNTFITQWEGCAINGQHNSRIDIDSAIVESGNGCGIFLNNATLNARNLQFSGISAPFVRPPVGIHAVDSEVTLTDCHVSDARIGVVAELRSTVTLINTEFEDVDQPTVAEGGSVIVAPPAPLAEPEPVSEPASINEPAPINESAPVPAPGPIAPLTTPEMPTEPSPIESAPEPTPEPTPEPEPLSEPQPVEEPPNPFGEPIVEGSPEDEGFFEEPAPVM
jgi:hypothetical protein